MIKTGISSNASAVLLITSLLITATPVLAQDTGTTSNQNTMAQTATGSPQNKEGVKVGVLTCNESSGWGFMFGSSRDVRCTFSPATGSPVRYTGTINKYGVNVGYLNSGVIVWSVLAPTKDASPGSLEGTYAGLSGSATVGVGAGVNVLVGGPNKQISLQPISIEGNTGLNIAAGVAELTLKHDKGSSGQATP